MTVRTVELSDPPALREAHALSIRIWGSTPNNPPITGELLRAVSHAGGYVGGAYTDDVLVGLSVGLLAAGTRLHSHLTGVDPTRQGRDLGFALKLHQRAWALARGIEQIDWTFDPLQRRNAYFNLTKLGATVTAYAPDFYGAMDDSLNAGSDQSDRLIVGWRLASEHVVRACAGTPDTVDLDRALGGGATIGLDGGEDGWPQSGPLDASSILIRIPADIGSLRAREPDCARAWRRALRQTLGHLIDAGAAATGCTKDGWYVLDRERARS